MTFTPTAEQQAIYAATTETEDNLLIRALAGTGKTSTLVGIAERLPKKSILCVAFNKDVQKEMQARLPDHAKARTLNSLGHKAWQDSLGRRLTLDTSKTFRLLKEAIASLDSEEDKKALGEVFVDLLHAIDAGKTAGYIPNSFAHPSKKPLMDDGDLGAWLEEEPSQLMLEIIEAVSVASLKEAFKGIVDFNDQLLMPTVFPSVFERFDLVMIDEAQDLSALNHAMVRKFAKKRVIAVGDECQAIYGFRGAHENSMDLIQKTFDMRQFSLTITWRCPILIVKEAQWRAPMMQWSPNAKEGTVNFMKGWNTDDIPDYSAIICRNNAPLLAMAMKLLRNGRYPELAGQDISKFLIKILRSLGREDMKRDNVLLAIDSWEDEKLAKSRVKHKIKDQAACLRIFAMQGNTLADAIQYAEHVFSVSGPIKLMTGHKAKGLEFDHVFFLDEDLIGKGGQEDNLRYVIQTRSKDTLTYVYTPYFYDPTEDEDEYTTERPEPGPEPTGDKGGQDKAVGADEPL